MSKIIDFFKKIPSIYYDWQKRNEKLNIFLEHCEENKSKLNHIDTTVTELSSELNAVENNVNRLESQLNTMGIRLDNITAGTKAELFETLRKWRVNLVVKKQWASQFEKKEVEEVYTIYHNHLKGNGQGEHYYNEIMALPESEEELRKREGVLK